MSDLEDSEQVEPFWIYGINDAKVSHSLDKAYSKTGNFVEDFVSCCKAHDIVPHPSLSTVRDQQEVICQGILMDRVSMKICTTLLPTSRGVTYLKFVNCKLDYEMLSLLIVALSDERSVVKSLVLDWNPLELSLPVDAEEANQSIEKLESLEIQRQQKQMERDTQLWCELIFEEGKFDNIEGVLSAILSGNDDSKKKTAVKRVTSRDDQMNFEQFCYNFSTKIGVQMQSDLYRAAFDYFDGPAYGGGEGCFSLRLVATVVEKFVIFEKAEDVDPTGLIYAKLLSDTYLENLSLRSNRISRLEIPELCDGLRKNRFLRQLNLFGNLISDSAVAVLADTFTENQTIQILGLGNNRITEIGLSSLASAIGAMRTASTVDADERIKKQKAGTAPSQSIDGNGVERWQREGIHVDELIEIEDRSDESGKMYYWFRNTQIRVVNLSNNAIRDSASTRESISLGRPSTKVMLKGNPLCPSLAPSYKQPSEDSSVGWACEF